MSGMISIEEARGRMCASIGPLPSETVALISAFGRVLAQGVIARADQPPFDASAMDGWAVRSCDGVSPRRFIGESAAGRPFAGEVGKGEAVRIFTGAALPFGADHVVVQEDAAVNEGIVSLTNLGKPNIRQRGGDRISGQIAVPKGCVLTGPRMALVAAAGVDPVLVSPKPRIAIIPTGDELTRPGLDPKHGAIFESVSFGLAGLIQAWGGVAHPVRAIMDSPQAISEAVKAAQAQADLVVIIGGASVGDHDYSRGAVGGELLVEKVAVRPGKPTWFTATQSGPILGLPGNPASALVCARLFLRPILETMQGLGLEDRSHSFRAQLTHDLPSNGPRTHVHRSIICVDEAGKLKATSQFDQDSSLLSPFLTANALIVQPPNSMAIPEGETAEAVWIV